METFRLLMFAGSQLERWEEFEAADVAAAIMHASQRGGDDRAELWSGSGRIAVFQPRRTRRR